MLVSVFLALFLPCAGMSAVFLVYICLLCYTASRANENQEFQGPIKPNQNKGLSASDLQKLPKVTGKDLFLGTDCAVCLDEIESEQPARMVPGCNHGFHLECADAWLSKNSICPVCRAKIGPDFLNPPQPNLC
ncbi:hypothetical protein CDL12_08727 [Handroanthus impetiginosus]|uniref:RING-type domain-containing protein n=1 Tax=Handroanthus impetiginosus TaxID=429701 RepID=A0A2G9HMS6_9LAMI|nr:hypothetical protein CDL12_08727 [Handroanthus impetiginosus]